MGVILFTNRFVYVKVAFSGNAGGNLVFTVLNKVVLALSCENQRLVEHGGVRSPCNRFHILNRLGLHLMAMSSGCRMIHLIINYRLLRLVKHEVFGTILVIVIVLDYVSEVWAFHALICILLCISPFVVPPSE